MPINKGILKEIECQIPVLKVLGLNPNGITSLNPQDSEYQFLADFSIYAMHHRVKHSVKRCLLLLP